MQWSTPLNLDCPSSLVVQWNPALQPPRLYDHLVNTTIFFRLKRSIVISDPVSNAASSLLRPGFFCPTLVVLTGFYYTVISKTRFSLHLGQTAFRWCIRDEPARRPRNIQCKALSDWHVTRNISVIQHIWFEITRIAKSWPALKQL